MTTPDGLPALPLPPWAEGRDCAGCPPPGPDAVPLPQCDVHGLPSDAHEAGIVEGIRRVQAGEVST